jgi:hypothetical protein
VPLPSTDVLKLMFTAPAVLRARTVELAREISTIWRAPSPSSSRGGWRVRSQVRLKPGREQLAPMPNGYGTLRLPQLDGQVGGGPAFVD